MFPLLTQLKSCSSLKVHKKLVLKRKEKIEGLRQICASNTFWLCQKNSTSYFPTSSLVWSQSWPLLRKEMETGGNQGRHLSSLGGSPILALSPGTPPTALRSPSTSQLWRKQLLGRLPIPRSSSLSPLERLFVLTCGILHQIGEAWSSSGTR